MRFQKIVLTAGFAIFSMFFGSGNLVFPLAVGVQSLDKAPFATLGLLIGGVLVPFLGLLAVILYKGDRLNFFNSIGKFPAFLLTFAMLGLMGPFGVLPRCIIVAYGGVQLFSPDFSFTLFSLIFCIFTLFLVWNHNRIIPILGRILTPWLLVTIFIIIIAGLIFGPAALPSAISSKQAFDSGIFTGYQTMDLLAAFFFSATTVSYILSHLPNSKDQSTLTKLSLSSCSMGAGILAVVYVCFIFLGAKYAPELTQVHPEQYLAHIAGLTLGPLATTVASITIALACLTTATVLTMLFSDFVHEDISRKKFGRHPAIILTLVIAYFVAQLGFGTLAVWIHTVLQVAYPALIALTLANIANYFWKVDLGRLAFWTVCVGSTIYYLFY